MSRHAAKPLSRRVPGRSPLRGEVWFANLNPTRGHEQDGLRPVLVVSDDRFNLGPAGLVIILPATTTARGIPAHVRVDPPEGGVKEASFLMCDQIRTVAKARLTDYWGTVSSITLASVEERLKLLLRL